MLTIKLKLVNTIDISDFQRQFNNVIRYAYNRFKKDKIENRNEVIRICKSKMNNIPDMDSAWIEYAVIKSNWFLSNDKSVIFGGKHNFIKRSKNKITNAEYKIRKLFPIVSIGASNRYYGNKKFQLDIINNNKIIFKQDRYTHIDLILPKLKKKYKEILFKLETAAKNHETPVTFELTNEYVSIIFDESILQKEYINFKPGRILSLDMNPNYIGISICDYNDKNQSQHIIHKEIITNKKINDIDIKKLPQKHSICKYQTNKRKYETFEINKYIVNLATTYHCEWIIYEKLNIESKDHKRGQRYNKMVNGMWNRTKMLENLVKNTNITGIKHQEIAAQYSSFIGQINNPEDIDSIAASLEINRRANLFIKVYKTKQLEKTEIVFPRINKKLILNRWKEEGITDKDLVDWKTLYSWVKMRKLNYRVLFDVNLTKSSFRLKSNKSLVKVYLL